MPHLSICSRVTATGSSSPWQLLVGTSLNMYSRRELELLLGLGVLGLVGDEPVRAPSCRRGEADHRVDDRRCRWAWPCPRSSRSGTGGRSCRWSSGSRRRGVPSTGTVGRRWVPSGHGGWPRGLATGDEERRVCRRLTAATSSTVGGGRRRRIGPWAGDHDGGPADLCCA